MLVYDFGLAGGPNMDTDYLRFFYGDGERFIVQQEDHQFQSLVR